jgi:hypothetical protein
MAGLDPAIQISTVCCWMPGSIAGSSSGTGMTVSGKKDQFGIGGLEMVIKSTVL